MSISDSPINTLSTILSEIPAVSDTEALFPELARNTDLGNALRARELYNELLQQVNPNDPNYEVYKVFVSHAKRIFVNALNDGLEPGSLEFTQYLDDSLLSNRPLVNYLARNGVNVLELIT